MACTKYTESQYIALNAAIAEGVQEVQYGDKTVKYRSLDEMKAIRIDMEACLYPDQNKNNARRFFSFSKGTSCRNRRRFL